MGLPFTATIRGDVINDTSINPSGILTGASGALTSAGGPDVKVTAAPRYNLRKDREGFSSDTIAGVPGFTIRYRASVEVRDDSFPAALNPRYGSSVLTGP